MSKKKRQSKEWGQFKQSTATVILVIMILLVITAILFAIPLNGKDSFQIGKSNYDFTWVSHAVKLGLDLEGGMYALYEADLSKIPSNEEKSNAMDGTISNLQAMLFSEGYTEATVTKQGENYIRVEVPSIENTEHLMTIIGEPATLEFKDPEGKVIIEGNKHLKNASEALHEGQYVISLEFNDEGRELFAKATKENIGKTISIYINGKEILKPTVNSAITEGRAIITGNYDYNTAKDLATKINAGTFAVKLDVISTASISPTLGQNALKYGLIASAIGIAIIILFLILVYRGLGLAASFALIIYSVLIVYFLAIVPWVQLTLPSIAGVILSIGMAVDANVIIFERIKEEKQFGKIGKGISTSVQYGFNKSLPAILDGNITTILGSIVMIIFGSTTIKSFAITLLIGILLSMFSALIITRLILKIMLSFNDENDAFYGLEIKQEKTKKHSNDKYDLELKEVNASEK
ncbi:MAG TPA: protein translocase subunit SecD [Clostridiales bacterium]|nr:protein translocase subunit SecD [Clostridiales bacterium]